MSTGPNPHVDSVLGQILSKYGAPEKVRFRNVETVTELVENLIKNGAGNLQVITDFDFTLTKTHANEKKCLPAADIIRQSPLMSEELKIRARERYDKLLPIEIDPCLTIEEKIPAVVSSFQEGFSDLVHFGNLNRKKIAQLITDADDRFQLRDNCDKTLQSLHEANVPVLIFSAGIGDLVFGILQKHSLAYPNIHVIANFMEFNEDNGNLLGFKEPLIHTFNKNESVIPNNCKYFDDLSQRENVIVIGDSIGDATMAQGVNKKKSVLKIGFLNEVDEEQLKIFLENFDIVLLDDQTMNFVRYLLEKIVLN